MFSRFVAMVSILAFTAAQMPQAFSQTVPPAPGVSAAQPANPVASHVLTVPAGTSIPLTLINPIRSRSSKPGDAVRATVAFPVTAGADVAIPAGSYVEGTIQEVKARTGAAGQPQVKIHFTRLLFANGYSVALDADSTQAQLDLPDASAPAVDSAAADEPVNQPVGASAPQAHLVLASYGQQEPTPPPLPSVGPSPAVVTGAVLGGGAAFTIGMLLWAHHRATSVDYVLFDSGWQFQIALEQPLAIDASRISTASAAATAN